MWRNVDHAGDGPGTESQIDPSREMVFRMEGHRIVLDQLSWCWSQETISKGSLDLFDCAVGLGEFLEQLEDDGRFRCWGIDVDPDHVAIAKQHAPSASISCRNALDTGFSPQCVYDVVVATALIEHVSDPSQLLKNIYHMTNRWALIMTPNCMRPAKVWEAVRGRIRWERSGHLQGWDYHLFHQQLEYHGFKVHRIDVRFVDCPWFNWWPWLKKKLSYGVLKRWFPMLGSEMFALCEKAHPDTSIPAKEGRCQYKQ